MAFRLAGRAGGPANGELGRRAGAAGLTRADIDVLEPYDPFSFEIIRQPKARGVRGPG